MAELPKQTITTIHQLTQENDLLKGKVSELINERDIYKNISRRDREELMLFKGKQAFPPGHFYSPIPDLEEIRRFEPQIFDNRTREVPGIDLRESAQIALLKSFADYYTRMPFPENKQPAFRYFFNNPAYAYTDGIILYCMLRHATPRRIIEVGSGYSSCMTLDTNELFFDQRIVCTFIEPYPKLLYSLMKPGDESRVEIIPEGLQSVPLEKFQTLESGDVLFIDSTHVAKIHSDVNYIFFHILPSLADGVYIHFHDVFYPFEYPKPWVYEGRAWNEDYLLRAFLQYNPRFEIVFFGNYLAAFHPGLFQEYLPLCTRNFGGSIWLRKIMR